MAREREASADEVARLLAAIQARYGYDLRDYHAGSIRRRIVATLARTGVPTIAELEARVIADAAFFHRVLEHLTVHVSELFRDPSFYRALREQLVPTLRTYPLIRIWHAGCASGEEAYASAILLREEALYDRCLIYATDVNPVILERARAGVFERSRLAAFAENYRQAGGRGELSDHVTAGDRRFTFHESLRKNIHFFQHDLVSDHVFGEMHVIFCRNVLIYFTAPLRQRVVAKLTASLAPGGFLCLGSSERLRRDGSDRFEPVVASERIYRHAG